MTGDAPDRCIEEGIDAGRSPQIPRAPIRVSQAEREAHEVTHVPFRSWWPYCVRGRGRNTPHKNRGGQREGRGVPKVSMDYFFMSRADDAASANPLLVMVDEGTGERYARAVGKKGLGAFGEMDWLVKDMAEELRSWGYTGGESGHFILNCLLYTSPSPRDLSTSRMPSSA